MSELYYLQDKRGYCGNSVMWWAIGGRGYTPDIRCAQTWTKDELVGLNYWEENEYNRKYKPWLKSEVDKFIQHHIDIQDINRPKDGSFYDEHPHTIVTHRMDLL